jgi:hypothetical protein
MSGMKPRVFFSVFFCAALSACGSETIPAPVGPPKPPPTPELQPKFVPADLTARIGKLERIEYEIKVGGLPAGKALLEVTRDDEKWPNGAQVWNTRLHVRSNRAFSYHYNVDDTHRSIIDQKAGFSRLYRMELNERKIRVDEKTAFNYDIGEMKAQHERSYDGRLRESVIPLSDKALDPLAALYYIRSIDFANLPNNEFFLPIFSERRVWNTRVRVRAVETPRDVGPWKARSVVLLEPELEFRGLFERRGPLKIWVDLKTGIPLKMECEIPVGLAEIICIDKPQLGP